MQSSILSYPSRGQWGKSSYRGNCSGTGKDVCKDSGINNRIHLDLLTGWNALIDEISTGNHLTFSHSKHWDIIDYSTQRGEFHAGDLSIKE